MTTKFTFLKDLELFMCSEGSLEQKKAPTRPTYNFKRLMSQLADERQDKVTNYQEHLIQSQERVQQLSLFHNTGLEELVSILKFGKLLPPEQLELQAISFSMRSTPYGVPLHLQQYVFAHCRHSNWLYGLYQIKFKPEVEELPGALFVPGEDFALEESTFKEHIMPISHWREFLAEEITVRKVKSANYSKNITSARLPEFLFPNSIDLELVESITCPTVKSKERLLSTLAYELPSTKILQTIPVHISPPEVLRWTNIK